MEKTRRVENSGQLAKEIKLHVLSNQALLQPRMSPTFSSSITGYGTQENKRYIVTHNLTDYHERRKREKKRTIGELYQWCVKKISLQNHI